MPTPSRLNGIETSVRLALEHYGNVHRGSGHNSQIATALYEHARTMILQHLGLQDDHVVIFCTPWRLESLLAQLPKRARPQVVSSRELGIAVGLRALVVRRADLPKGTPAHPGGGTVRMVSDESVDWADAPDRFEAGTPNVLGAIALARALTLADDRASSQSDEKLDDPLADLAGSALLRALRSRQLGGGALVPTLDGPRPFIHFDNGASTPTFEPVWQAVRQAWRMDKAGRAQLIRDTKDRVHGFFGAPAADYDAFFASNTSEAIALASSGLGQLLQPGSVVVNTAIEHNSNELPWRFLENVTQVRLPADRDGFLDLAHLETVLRAYNQDHIYGARRVRLVSVCGASNVMGTCNDLHTIARLAHAYGAQVLVDAAQLAPHRRILMAEQGIDLLAFSAHKMYAPFGSGGLIARKGLVALAPMRHRLAVNSGEENLAGLASLHKAIELLERIGMDTLAQDEKALTRYALARLSEIPGLRIYGLSDPSDARLAHKAGVICFELDGMPHNLLARLLAERGGIGTRSGCFCVNLFVKRLLGIGRLKNAVARTGLALLPRTTGRLLTGLVRVSFGLTNHRDDVDRLVEVLSQIAHERRRPSDRVFAKLHFGTPFLPHSPTAGAIDELVSHKTQQVFTPTVA